MVKKASMKIKKERSDENGIHGNLQTNLIPRIEITNKQTEMETKSTTKINYTMTNARQCMYVSLRTVD